MLQQSNLFEQYTRVLQTLSRQKPLLLVLDDLQWIDAGSASLLFHLGRRISGNRILIMGAFRPDEIVSSREEERHPLDAVIHELKRDFGNIEIEVGKTEGRAFVEALIDSEPNLLGNEFRKILYQQTKGHALFTVELLRNMQDSGFILRDGAGRWVEGPDPNWDELPARVDAVIEERISRLTEESRDILTTASVEGEEFTAEVISQMLNTGVLDLVKLLSKDLDKRHHLVSAKGMRKLNLRRLSLYLFQQILFQRYLYNNLDTIERVHLHGEVGYILENLYGDQADEISVQLARHFHEAGEIEKAIVYFHKAGDKAVKVSANQEAIKHFKQALELLFTLPESLDRDKLELSLQLALTIPIMATKGFAAPELGRAAKRARELCQKFGDTPEVFIAIMQMCLYYSTLPEYRTALELVDEAIKLAEKLGDPMLQAMSWYYHCWAKLNLGELTESYESTKKINALYDPEKHGHLAYVFGYDMGVVSLLFGGWALWLLGYPDKANEQINTAIAHARIIEHPNTMAFAFVGGIFMNLLLCNRELIDKYSDELSLLSNKNGLLFWIGHAQIYAGERKILKGEVKEGIAEMRKGVATIQTTGSETCLSRLLTRMAEACREVGEVEEGLMAVEDALEFRRRFDEVYMEPELYRLKGELLLLQGAEDKDVEECFHNAIGIAQGQESKSLELRAVMSLSRLLQKRNKSGEAKDLLEEIYGWFTEGFDTPDLLQAKALLAELS
jgi:predicted ATPase